MRWTRKLFTTTHRLLAGATRQKEEREVMGFAGNRLVQPGGSQLPFKDGRYEDSIAFYSILVSGARYAWSKSASNFPFAR